MNTEGNTRIVGGRGQPAIPQSEWRAKRAVTLIEVLVVIGIMSLLMAILLPAIDKVKRQARAIACTNNMRQIGIAAGMYAEDWNFYIPRAAQDTTGLWFELFMPYLGHGNVTGDYSGVENFRCPSYPDRRQRICYVVNGWQFLSENDQTGFETTEPTKLSTCRQREKTIYLADGENGWWRKIVTCVTDDGVDRFDVWNTAHLPASDLMDFTFGRRVGRRRHRKGANCLYLDWHVGYVPAVEMTLDMWRFHTPKSIGRD